MIKCHIENHEVRFKALLIPSVNAYRKPKAKLTNTKQKQGEFWQEFHKYTTENNSPVKISHPAPQHWQYISIGMSGVSIQLTINTAKNNLGCELLIAKDQDDNQVTGVELDWKVADSSGTIVFETEGTTAKSALKPGEYSVVVSGPDIAGGVQFTVGKENGDQVIYVPVEVSLLEASLDGC